MSKKKWTLKAALRAKLFIKIEVSQYGQVYVYMGKPGEGYTGRSCQIKEMSPEQRIDHCITEIMSKPWKRMCKPEIELTADKEAEKLMEEDGLFKWWAGFIGDTGREVLEHVRDYHTTSYYLSDDVWAHACGRVDGDSGCGCKFCSSIYRLAEELEDQPQEDTEEGEGKEEGR
jgi:hypothetical protein